MHFGNKMAAKPQLKLQYLDLGPYIRHESIPCRFYSPNPEKSVPPTRQKPQNMAHAIFQHNARLFFDPALEIPPNYRINITSHSKGNALYGSIMVSKANLQEKVK